jgi:hypothetical protein
MVLSVNLFETQQSQPAIVSKELIPKEDFLGLYTKS